jgi:dynein assembly factor 3
MEPIGAHQFWGYSPALDVQQVHSTVFGAHANEADDASTPLNILLVNAGDARHVLKTIAQRFRHSVRPLHFYVYERSSEVLARHMLQLAVACDWELPLRQRTAVWLELYGNALLQARTARYLGTKLKSVLIDVLCNERGPAPLPALWDLSLLKYKQRDELEATLKAWDEAVPFDMATLRDYRLRHHYGERYDHRNNLIDWDYQTGVRPCAGSIHYTTFREWRNSGVAFEFGDQVYSEPNRTLASYVEGKEAGRGSVSRRGFWGDILVGPYHAVGTAAYVPTDAEAAAAAMARGLQSAELAASAGLPAAPVCAGPSDTAAAAVESLAAAGVASTVSAAALAPGTAAASTAADAAAREAGPDPRANYAWQLFDIQGRHLGSEQWRHHAVEVAVYNVLCWLFEIETGRQYAMRREHDVYSGLAEANLIPAAYAAATAASARAMPTATRAAAVAAVADSGATGAGDAAETAQQGTGTCSASGAGAASHAAAAGAAAASEPVGPPPALLRAEAAARARTIGRAFQGVTISWMAGDMAEWMARGKLAGR